MIARPSPPVRAAAILLAAVVGLFAGAARAEPDRSFGSLGGRVPVAVSEGVFTVSPRPGVSARAARERLSREPALRGYEVFHHAGAGGLLALRARGAVDSAPSDSMSRLAESPEIAWILPAVTLPDGTPLGLTADIVVVLAPGADPAARARVEARVMGAGARVTGEIPRVGALRVSLDAARGLTPDTLFALCEELRGEPGVADAHPDFLRFGAERRALNDPRAGDQWYLGRVGLPDAFEVTMGSPEVVIAVVDDGFDLTHEDLPGPARRAPGAFDFRDHDDDPSAGLDDRHGTAVAGIALASADNCKGITGACPGCAFLPVRRGSTDYADMEAFDYLTSAGVHVVNNSWGYTHPSTGVLSALQTLVKTGRGGRGTMVVFAAGNEGRDIDATFDIAATPGVIAVASTGRGDEPAESTNHGASLAFAAPGSGLATTDRTVEGYEAGPYTMSFGGTSGAAPIVAGAAGLVFSLDPDRTAEEVRAALASTAHKVGSDYDAEGRSPTYGYGRIDVAAAVAAAAGVDRATLGAGSEPAPACGAAPEALATPGGCAVSAGAAASDGDAHGVFAHGVFAHDVFGACLACVALGLMLARRRGGFWYHRRLLGDAAPLDRGEALTDPARQLVEAALAGEAAAIRALVAELTPIVHASAARALIRRRAAARGGDTRQLLDDVVQDAFVELLRDGGKVLRSWDPARGKGLHGFVALVAEQRVGAALRTRRRNPWSEDLAGDDVGHELASPADPERSVASRQELHKLFERVHAELTPLGRELFQKLIVDEEPIAHVAESMTMSTSAVQAWSSRLKRLIAKVWAEISAEQGPEGTEADA